MLGSPVAGWTRKVLGLKTLLRVHQTYTIISRAVQAAHTQHQEVVHQGLCYGHRLMLQAQLLGGRKGQRLHL